MSKNYTLRRTETDIAMVEWMRQKRGEHSCAETYSNVMREVAAKMGYRILNVPEASAQKELENPELSPGWDSMGSDDETPADGPLLRKKGPGAGGMTWDEIEKLKART